jgi:hypothetical protein
MAKTTPSRKSVYVAAAIVIVVTALWAVLFVPRLAVQPEAIKDGAADSAKTFFKLLLAAAVVLVACVVLSRLVGRIISGVISGLLYLAAGLVLIHDFMMFNGAVYYLEEYEGFSTVAIVMLICVGANLIAAILAIIAANKYRTFALPRDW